MSVNFKWHLGHLERRYICENDYYGEDKWCFSIFLALCEFIEMQQNRPIHNIIYDKIFYFKKCHLRVPKPNSYPCSQCLNSVRNMIFFYLLFYINFY